MAGADVDAAFLYAGAELIQTSSAKNAEISAAGQEATFQGTQELGELGEQLAERRAKAKELEGQLAVLRQQVAATEEAHARATRELAETRAQLEVERRRVELEVQSLRDHLNAEREAARTSVKETFEQAGRERAQLQEAARQERERTATERTELATVLRQEREAHAAERTALRAALLQDLDRMRAAHQEVIDKLAASHQQQRDQMADQLEKDRQRNQVERDRLQREVAQAAEDAKKTMAASLESMNLAAESVATVGGRVRKLVHDVIEGDQAVVDESIARKVAAAQAIRETTEEVKKNLAEQTAPGPSAWDEFIKAGAKVLGRVDPHKVMKLSPRLRKILEDEGDDD